MDSSSASLSLAADEPPRVKFLCSFGGSILPRPLDGRLRYVGGETRIVSVSRDITFDELSIRLGELHDGGPSSAIKYQQPDEDLDALVSVVNDDDVTNMVEECDKLSSLGEGFTRLRVFLFSLQHPEMDSMAAVSHFDAGEWETERRYVDALNSLSDGRLSYQHDGAFGGGGFVDTGLPNHLQRLNIPHPSHLQRFGGGGESAEGAQWSPAYYSPRHSSPQDHQREFSSPPLSARYNASTGELNDRVAEELMRRYHHHPHQYDHQLPPLAENMSRFPPGGIAGIPGHSSHANPIEGASICDHCRIGFQRVQPHPMQDPRLLDSRWKHSQPQTEQCGAAAGNEYGSQLSNSCADCYGKREANAREQSEHRSFYNDYHGHDSSWVLHHHPSSHCVEDPRMHLPGPGRAVDRYIFNGNGIGHPLLTSNINQEDARYAFPRVLDVPIEVHEQQAVGTGVYLHAPGMEDIGMRLGSHHVALGSDNLYHNPSQIHPSWRNFPAPSHAGTAYEAIGMMGPNGVSPKLPHLGGNGQIQNPWPMQNGNLPHKLFGFDALTPDTLNDIWQISNPIVMAPDNHPPVFSDFIPCKTGRQHVENPSSMMPMGPSPCNPSMDKVVAPHGGDDHGLKFGALESSTIGVPEGISAVAECGQVLSELGTETDAHINSEIKKQHDEVGLIGPKAAKEGHSPKHNLSVAAAAAMELSVSPIGPMAAKEGHPPKHNLSVAAAALELADITPKRLNFLPELIASVKKAALESAEKVKSRAQEDVGDVLPLCNKKELSLNISGPGGAPAELEAYIEDDHPKIAKIEPTSAEAEALAKGLQTIKNDDLEEIRQLGSGTFGSVYYGKWKGSDVAIKRIKSSCFDGKPSERERLIADFWKEALLMSSLHHPNVVSFYGVVRDGPGGCLATVTEFMVNGSLKKILQKKDRTIDRRKRLILAMDAAFGMEYLHGKNVVHFDLKCENLLVNMRDPQRPICKIGDLGLSKVKKHTMVSGGVRGTLPWMAPELLSGRSSMVSEKIDVYSFGIVMWELLTGEEPYADMYCASIIGGIVSNSLRPNAPTWCDPEWKSLMESCWSADPGERPSFCDISKKLRKMAAAINVK